MTYLADKCIFQGSNKGCVCYWWERLKGKRTVARAEMGKDDAKICDSKNKKPIVS